jgi:hypothetical protein
MKKIKTDKIFDLFKENKKFNSLPIILTKLPEEIFNEILKIVENHRKIKEHKLNFLFEHYNAGYNSFQISVQKPVVETSFIFPYLITLGQFYFYIFNKISFEQSHRTILLRENVNHYDGYELWINYTEQGDENPPHKHSGHLTGVIYVKNTDNIPTVFNQKEKFYGKPGEIIIFPADLEHGVEKQIENFERITMSFNLYLNETK